MSHHRAFVAGSLAFLFAISLAGSLLGEDQALQPVAARKEANPPAPPASEAAAAERAHPLRGPSEAERISRLDRSIQADEKRLRELKEELNEPNAESAEAQQEFEQLDGQLIERKKQLESATKSGRANDVRKLKAQIADLEKKWTLARDRFELLIGERKAVQESIAALEEKVEHDREALDELRGEGEPHAKPELTSPTASKHKTAAAPAHSASQATHLANPAAAALEEVSAESAKPAAAEEEEEKSEMTEEEAAELAAAEEAAKQADAAADAAEEEAKSIAERIVIAQKNITLARKLRETAQKKVDNEDAALKSLNEELFRVLMSGGNTDQLKSQIQEAIEQVREAREESREAASHLDGLQSSLAALQAEQLATAAEVEEKRRAADEAADVVKELNNPFSPHNMLQWSLDHGPKILTILIAMMLAMWVSRVVESRLVSLIASRGGLGNKKDRENRAKTLLGIFHNVANIVVLGGGIVVVLDEVGIPIAPLIGGAAVVGLAVAFGAQSLIKDYFTGFLVLLEHQYLVNDVVSIGSISGQVERITLRTTILRDGEGHVHFIPHGQINTVTNTTYGWCRAVFEIRVSYREDIDQVIAVLKQLATEMRHDEKYAGMILDDPVMQGVDALTDAAVVVKFNLKTRPLTRNEVKRELLRRIKNKFDELDISFATTQPAAPPRNPESFPVVAEQKGRKAS